MCSILFGDTMGLGPYNGESNGKEHGTRNGNWGYLGVI